MCIYIFLWDIILELINCVGGWISELFSVCQDSYISTCISPPRVIKINKRGKKLTFEKPLRMLRCASCWCKMSFPFSFLISQGLMKKINERTFIECYIKLIITLIS